MLCVSEGFAGWLGWWGIPCTYYRQGVCDEAPADSGPSDGLRQQLRWNGRNAAAGDTPPTHHSAWTSLQPARALAYKNNLGAIYSGLTTSRLAAEAPPHTASSPPNLVANHLQHAFGLVGLLRGPFFSSGRFGLSRRFFLPSPLWTSPRTQRIITAFSFLAPPSPAGVFVDLP
jgi:hypothetical protein